MAEFTDYEQKIVDDLRGTEERGGRGRTALRGIRWIRGYLLQEGEDYCYHAWKRYRTFWESAGFKGPSYNTFRFYFWLLGEMGLLERRKEEPGGSAGHILRVYYGIRRGQEGSPLWERSPWEWFRERKKE